MLGKPSSGNSATLAERCHSHVQAFKVLKNMARSDTMTSIPRQALTTPWRTTVRPALCGLLLLVGLLPVNAAAAQKRPDVHTDFRFGVFPYDPQNLGRFDSEQSRLLISALHRGWDVDKFLDDGGEPEVEVLTLLDELERDRLIRGPSDFDMRPGFPVLREDELAVILPAIADLGAGLANVIERNWTAFEEFLGTLEAGAAFPADQNMYRVVAGGVLFEGLVDALYDDKTLMPSPPRRAGRNNGFYAWMTEGDAGPRQLIHQTASVGRYEVVSIGPDAPAEPRVQISVLGETAPVYEYEDARRWRVFTSIMSRDELLPYLKTRRQSIIDLHVQTDAARYTAVAEFMAWFYVSAATEAVEILVDHGRIAPPASNYRYARFADR
jgi:hypothetical protein